MSKKKWHCTGDLKNHDIIDNLNKLSDLGVSPNAIKITRGGHGTRIYFYMFDSVLKEFNK